MKRNRFLIFLMSMFLFVSVTSYHLEAHAGIKKYIFGWVVWQGTKVGVKSCLKDPKCRKALKEGSIKRGSKLGQLAIKRYGPKVRKASSKLAKWARKKFSNAPKKANFSKLVPTTHKQLQKKFKHAKDFGVEGSFNKVNANKFNTAIQRHLNASGTKEINGIYRGDQVTFHTNPESGLTVIQKQNGNFLSGWKLNPRQLRHVLKDGKL